MGFSLPTDRDWLTVLEILLYVVGSGGTAIAAALITARHARRDAQSMRAQVTAINDQVVNGHGGQPPLRADLDEIRDAVHDIRRDQVEMRADIRDLREDLRIERDDIVELQQRVVDLTPIRRRRKEMP